MIVLGRHITVEFYDCNPRIINDAEKLSCMFLAAAKASNATILHHYFHHFSPQGVSGIIVIGESHLSVHTWPEHDYAAVDFFTCGTTVEPLKAFNFLQKALGSKKMIISADMQRGLNCINRGFADNPNLSLEDKFKEENAWGLLSSVDVYGCKPELIRDANHIKQYVLDLCDLIKMKRFGDTVVVDFGEDERVSGFSMTQLIETSLISGHFANQSNAIYIDIFSCKYYDPREAAEFTIKRFGGERYSLNIALRK